MFTVESANQLLPEVRPIVSHARRLYAKLVELRTSFDEVPNASWDELVSTSEADPRATFRLLERQLERLIYELKKLGVNTANLIQGAVGFPAKLGEETVELSWIDGEEEIRHYHPLDGDPEDRVHLHGQMEV